LRAFEERWITRTRMRSPRSTWPWTKASANTPRACAGSCAGEGNRATENVADRAVKRRPEAP
jgi:hypothetical protein